MADVLANFVVLPVLVLLCLLAGTACIIWPKQIQARAIEVSGKGWPRLLNKLDPFSALTDTKVGTWTLRLCGVLLLGSALLFIRTLIAIIRGTYTP
jgi:hypothetical protein